MEPLGKEDIATSARGRSTACPRRWEADGADLAVPYLTHTQSTSSSTGGTTSLSYHTDSSQSPTNHVKTMTSTAAGTSEQGVDTSTADSTYSLDERNQKRKGDGLDFIATVYVHDSAGNVTSVQTNRYAPNTNPDQKPLPTYQEQLRKTSYIYGTGGMNEAPGTASDGCRRH